MHHISHETKQKIEKAIFEGRMAATGVVEQGNIIRPFTAL